MVAMKILSHLFGSARSVALFTCAAAMLLGHILIADHDEGSSHHSDECGVCLLSLVDDNGDANLSDDAFGVEWSSHLGEQPQISRSVETVERISARPRAPPYS